MFNFWCTSSSKQRTNVEYCILTVSPNGRWNYYKEFDSSDNILTRKSHVRSLNTAAQIIKLNHHRHPLYPSQILEKLLFLMIAQKNKNNWKLRSNCWMLFWYSAPYSMQFTIFTSSFSIKSDALTSLPCLGVLWTIIVLLIDFGAANELKWKMEK